MTDESVSSSSMEVHSGKSNDEISTPLEKNALVPEGQNIPHVRRHKSFGQRHILALWLCGGYSCIYTLRTVINVAIVSMGDFDWNHATQGLILSSFYYGYVCTQMIGGYLVRHTGARYLFAFGVGIPSVLTILNPLAAWISPSLLVAARVLSGLVDGCTLPTGHYILSKWAPPGERAILTSIAWSGLYIGTVSSAFLTGILCEYAGFLGGWPTAFYLFGIIGLVWCVGWLYAVRDCPSKHPRICEKEKLYLIHNSHAHPKSKAVSFSQVPWKAIATSAPFWAVAIAHTGANWAWYTMLVELPTYMKDVLHMRPAMNGFLLSIPYILQFFLSHVSAFISDKLHSRGVRVVLIRKSIFVIGMVPSGISLIIISHIGCRLEVVMTLLCISIGMNGFAQTGFVVNHFDLAPQYASIMMGISNTMASVTGIMSPLLTGAIINEQSTLTTWQTIFYISAAVSIGSAIAFALMADGKIQPWAVHHVSNEVEDVSVAITTVETDGADDRN